MYRKCRYLREGRHPSPNDIPDNFADKVIGVFSAGIQACMQTGVGDEAPGKKIKPKSINLTWQQLQPMDTKVGKGDRDKLRDKLREKSMCECS